MEKIFVCGEKGGGGGCGEGEGVKREGGREG